MKNKGKVDILLGLQWGDEGKGKIVDYFTPKYNIIARFQGGPNAGHTIIFENRKHVLHQIPSGIFHNGVMNIIGNGVVLDPVVFRKEIEDIVTYQSDVKSNLFISNKINLILPTHKLLDQAYEKYKGNEKIGSTLKGIGPAYQDKIARSGIRVGDINSYEFADNYKKIVAHHKKLLDLYDFQYSLQKLELEFNEALDFLKEFKIADTETIINHSLNNGLSILAEGAQGSLLDVDFGSYPFVTSSNTMAGGACSGLGISPRLVGDIFGIFKAYCTRVGSGPFPTELSDPIGGILRDEGHEFGATTGRPRRCGWLDLPALKYAIMINGVTQLIMMKADVLNQFHEIKVCTHYKLENGENIEVANFETMNGNVTPIYKTIKGWNSELPITSDYNQIPDELKSYISYLEIELELPITIISVGPDRSQTILRQGVLID